MGYKKNIIKSFLAAFLCLSMVLGIVAGGNAVQAQAGDKRATSQSFVGDGFTVTFSTLDFWGDGHNASVVITNTGSETIYSWVLKFTLDQEIYTTWNATVLSQEGSTYVVKNAGHNRDIAPGESVYFGMGIKGEEIVLPTDVSMPVANNTVSASNYEVDFNVRSDWSTGCDISVKVTNKGSVDIEGWKISFDLDREIAQIYSASIVSHEGTTYVIQPANYYNTIRPGKSISFGFQLTKGDLTEVPTVFTITDRHVSEYVNGLTTTPGEVIQASPTPVPDWYHPTQKPDATSKPTEKPETSEKPEKPDRPEVTVTPEITGIPTGIPTVTPEITGIPTVTPEATATPTPLVKADGKLSVSGRNLVDEEGNVVQLRGISTHGLSWFPEYVNEDLIEQMHDEWNCDVIRLAMYTAEYNGYCTGDEQNRTNLKNLIDKGVNAAADNDMYVIIDWHVLTDQNPNLYKNDAKEFFAEMAQKYADYDNVIFEICNEPNGNTSWQDIKSYADEIIPVIREYTDAVVIVGTPTWSQEVDKAAADRLDYENVVYALHFYADTHRDSLRNTLKAAADADLPIFVSEFGSCDASGNGVVNKEEADKWIELLDEYAISYVGWSLCNKPETSSVISSSVDKKSGFTFDDLSESGKWLISTIQASASSADADLPDTDSSDDALNPDDDDYGYIADIFENIKNGKEPWNTPSQAYEHASEQGFIHSSANSALHTPSAPSENGELSVEVINNSSWESRDGKTFSYSLSVKNGTSQKINGWTITLVFDGNIEKVDLWGAKYTKDGNTLVLTPAGYTSKVEAGSQTGGIGMNITISTSNGESGKLTSSTVQSKQ